MAKKKPIRRASKSPARKPTKFRRPMPRSSEPLPEIPDLARIRESLHHDLADIAVPPRKLPPFLIVGIGASAGGLEACTQLLENLRKPNFAIIIVQHLAPEHESALPGLLAGITKIPVIQVTEGMRIEPGRVHVIPPGVQMGIADGILKLVPRPDDRTQHMSIDYFFRSLAEHAQSRAIGVILSGSAHDGAAGLREIKDAGGIAIAQDPETARFDSMPRAAIATGAVDLVLAPHKIADELTHIAQRPLGDDHETTQHHAPRHPEENLARVFSILRNATGVDFAQYKLPTIRRRLQRRMVLHKIETLADYVRLLQKNADEVHALYEDILIHVTRFFREPESFQALVTKVFPRLIEHRDAESPIRVWVPGCSTGEEA